jgi:hypothetical protein
MGMSKHTPGEINTLTIGELDEMERRGALAESVELPIALFKELVRAARNQLAATPILLDALEAINRQACPQPDRTGVMAMSDLELITDIARAALAKATE